MVTRYRQEAIDPGTDPSETADSSALQIRRMKHSISQAAKLANVARTTLYDAIRSGKIATETDGRGRKLIDTAELLRVFGELHADGLPHNETLQPRTLPTTPTHTPTAVLEEKIKGLEALLAARDAELSAYREREQRLMQLLGSPTPAEPAPKRRRWWLFGRR